MSCGQQEVGGAFNTVSESGFATMGTLLEAARSVTQANATLVWLTPEEIAVGLDPEREVAVLAARYA